jgi:Cytochrome bd-type quinol oxidase, subunit 1
MGAFYTLRKLYPDQARLYLKYGTAVGFVASLLVAYPTGDEQAKMVGRHQEVSLAAMEGRFHSGPMAEISMIGQPNVRERKLENPIAIPGILSYLVNGSFHSNVRGLEEFPEDTWPDNIELLYLRFSSHGDLGHVFHRADDGGQCSTTQRKAGIKQLAALALDAGISVSLYRKHAGLDDYRIRAPTVASLWSFPNE